MKKYLLVLSAALILSGGCTVTAAKSSTIHYEESRVVEKPEKNTEEKPVKKAEVKKQRKKAEADIIYKGINEKAEIKYNISKNLLTYKINPDKRMLIRAGSLAGLLYINDKTYYTNYSASKIKASGCIYDTSTKNIVVNPNVKCRIEMIIIVDDMPESSQIESVRYKSDLGEFTLNKADK